MPTRYREFRLYVDGALAGVAAPFPVVYTGGIVPYLWRPLTGIESFDVPAYRFDVTPFAALLNDGKNHTIACDVAFANNASGVWYLDPVLLAWSADAPAPLTGAVTAHAEDPLRVTVRTAAANFTTRGGHGVSVTGYVEGPMNPRVTTTVATRVAIDNENDLVSATRQVTAATIASTSETTRVAWNGATSTFASTNAYPIAVDLVTAEPNNVSLYLGASVEYAYERSYVAPGVDLKWSDGVAARATLNETDEPGAAAKYELGTGATKEAFTVNASGQTCYVHRLAAANGTVVEDDETPFACALPAGLRFCGATVCGEALPETTGAARPPRRCAADGACAPRGRCVDGACEPVPRVFRARPATLRRLAPRDH